MNHLDPNKSLISHRLFRDHCWQTEEGIYIKDLRVLKNRSLENILLVDNAAYSYFYQLDNGIPIIPYYDDKSDRELIKLLEFLKEIIKVSEETSRSLKILNSQYFKLDKYVKYDDINPLVQQLYQKEFKGNKMI